MGQSGAKAFLLPKQMYNLVDRQVNTWQLVMSSGQMELAPKTKTQPLGRRPIGYVDPQV